MTRINGKPTRLRTPPESVCPHASSGPELSRIRDGATTSLTRMNVSPNLARRDAWRVPAELEGSMSTCLKRTLARALAATAFTLAAAGTANAAYIQADLTRVGGNTWDASFTVGADAGQTVEAFSIYFDWTKVSNLQVWGSPSDWDSLVVQADGGLASDGYFDALALADGIVAPKDLGGFIARFDWAESAGPTMFSFTINDPVTFDALEAGAVDVTTNGGGGTIPEPGTLALLALAGAAAWGRRRRIDASQ